jgi:heat shock protein HtpX
MQRDLFKHGERIPFDGPRSGAYLFSKLKEGVVSQLKTFFLMAGLMAFLVVIGGVLGGQTGAIVCFAFALVMNAFMYWNSGSMVLKMYKASPVTEAEAPRFYRSVQRMASNASLPMPKVALIPMDQPNAFATGRNPKNAVVAVTTGLLNMVDDDELDGVVAHELGHVQNRDILISTIAAAMVGAITMLATIAKWGAIFGRGRGGRGLHPAILILLAILAPIAAMLIQMMISRNREYMADAAGARISGKPMALASALQKLETFSQNRPVDVNPSTAHMFIVNPLGAKGAMASLFRTHPTTQDRVSRLREMA